MAANNWLNPDLFRKVRLPKHSRADINGDSVQYDNFPESFGAHRNRSLPEHRVVSSGYHVMPTKLGQFQPLERRNLN